VAPEGGGLFTKEGTTLGTTPYMPPEQARGRAIDERADLFAVGATMFRLLTGRYLHEASSAFDLLLKMGRDPAPPISSIAKSLPENICVVVDRALAFDRDQRYKDARAMLEDVRAVMRGASPPHAGPLVDSRATLPDAPPVISPAATSTKVGSDSDVPIYLSGFSSEDVPVADDASTDPNVAQDGGHPQTPAPDEAPTPQPRVPPKVETTLISPGSKSEPPKGSGKR
jgi:serine/threonine protein kinase